MKVDNPKDVRDLIIQIISDILENKKTIAQAGTISHMLGVWLKAYELDRASEFDKRLAAVEEAIRK